MSRMGESAKSLSANVWRRLEAIDMELDAEGGSTPTPLTEKSGQGGQSSNNNNIWGQVLSSILYPVIVWVPGKTSR